MINSKQKGKRGELEVAKLLREYGFEARRGQQFSGSPDSPDVVHNIPGFHIEVKFTERLNVYDAMDQADKDKGEQSSLVFHRRSLRPWLVVLRANTFLKLIKELNETRSKS